MRRPCAILLTTKGLDVVALAVKVILYTKVKQDRPSVPIMQEILEAGGATIVLATTAAELGERDRRSHFLLLNKEVKRVDKGIGAWIEGGGLVLGSALVFDLVSQQQRPRARDYVLFGGEGDGALLDGLQADLEGLWGESASSGDTSTKKRAKGTVGASSGTASRQSSTTKRRRH